MAAEQSFKSHTALDPITHFTLLPLGLIALGLSLYLIRHDWPLHRLDHLWMILASMGLILLNLKSRMYPLAVQDRVIRLEGRLRLHELMPEEHHSIADQLTTRQFVALRFACDAELPALARKAVAENLDGKTIKQNIGTWRPDYNRI
ncbi:DUF6526 family protein [Granulicella tundricola]|uniref:Uncharacterized protein n=1 Tax=Granulicella tundricola (strain ATCC BAA-1859 / DSM 23138 / MP5ACTX9) TaxID=1198114 RepID=E8X205_GRATM|nr:DUF6526 family protein [Granulicella tundricola]ADW69166.1 hypothetical protein AciX9_2122 [Granulicella tundricola MP5ACTX9]